MSAPPKQRPERLVAVLATTASGLMGCEHGLPWHCPGDLRHFRALTWGHPILMGRRTWDTIGRPLPGRSSIVLSRRPRPASLPEQVRWCASVPEALAAAAAAPGGACAYVIGGRQIYELLWPELDEVVHSRIEAPGARGDLFFDLARLGPPDWEAVGSTTHPGFLVTRWRRRR
ncbi:MAG: dihydrofolate reductase [Planctomycetota bacterium]|nr:MAG: dihydrofolate reductase [Planctomycetota bacterium]